MGETDRQTDRQTRRGVMCPIGWPHNNIIFYDFSVFNLLTTV